MRAPSATGFAVACMFGKDAIDKYDEQNFEGISALTDGVNKGLQMVDVPLHIGPLAESCHVGERSAEAPQLLANGVQAY